ncbi:hypothetical protein J6590_059084 [Homalodisca vitripennis]|nr:hypothetical protein J6590_059084 [Homalodisca vitripennis]
MGGLTGLVNMSTWVSLYFRPILENRAKSFASRSSLTKRFRTYVYMNFLNQFDESKPPEKFAGLLMGHSLSCFHFLRTSLTNIIGTYLSLSVISENNSGTIFKYEDLSLRNSTSHHCVPEYGGNRDVLTGTKPQYRGEVDDPGTPEMTIFKTTHSNFNPTPVMDSEKTICLSAPIGSTMSNGPVHDNSSLLIINGTCQFTCSKQRCAFPNGSYLCLLSHIHVCLTRREANSLSCQQLTASRDTNTDAVLPQCDYNRDGAMMLLSMRTHLRAYSLFEYHLSQCKRLNLDYRMFFHGTDMESLHTHIHPKFLPKVYGGIRPDFGYRDWFESLSKNPRIVEQMELLGYKKENNTEKSEA